MNVMGILVQESKVGREGMRVLLGIKFNEVGVHRGVCFRSS